MRARGQALIELALCAPLVVALALGTVAGVQVATARSGLEAATQAAAEVAARAPNIEGAIAGANLRFQSVVSGYPLRSSKLVLSLDDFDGRGSVTASSSASTDIGWAVLLLPGQVALRSRVRLPLEPWRSHSG